MTDASIIQTVERYYTTKIQQHGATPQGVDWNGAHSQQLRFDQLLEVIDDTDRAPSINDYGCGYGGLLEPLARRFDEFDYRGYDISPAMIEIAEEHHRSEPRATFFTREDQLLPADFTLASGVFNVRLTQAEDVWRRYVFATIDKLASLTRRGLAFNALTSHADRDRMRPDLYYADPAEMLDRCLKRYSRDVSVRHDYGLYEFTVIVRLDRRPPASRMAEGT
jgi:SAM-dependent methyltransferase